MKVLGVLKENTGVTVVCLTPNNVASLVKDYTVLVEKGAGDDAGFSDQNYKDAGAQILDSRNKLINQANIILTHHAHIDESELNEHKIVIGGYNVLDDFTSFIQFTNANFDLYSLSLLPRTTIAQSMDILSSLASLSGYQSVVLGLNKLKTVAPMISGAGGTLPPSNILILGAGVAGLQAIATAKRMGAVVYAFDIRKQTKTEVESLGGKFIQIEGAVEDENSGGYAVEQGDDFMQKVNSTLTKYIKTADLIITTARIPGKRAPLLINESMFDEIKRGAVVIDLAADTGGNCAYIQPNEELIKNDVRLIGNSALYESLPGSASVLLGNNMTAFLKHYNQCGSPKEDEILQSTLVVKNGEVVHEKICEEISNY
ncbi:Rossmann-fold NAD(P)-binding domain-containing protein [Crocinitomix algicola]|uniref:hypothetical protein n=1 Tax=Crocinitomix algicola TaxID=1740263 RepID=UPI0008364B14|nr:hypothetical protein [Crocinitomix algicola]